MSKYTKEDIIQIADEEDVEFIRLQFSDILGNLKNVAITRCQLERALDNRYMFDGSSIPGFVSIEESDMYLHPDLDTFTIFPWRPQQGKVARIICSVHRPDGSPFEGDSRMVLKNTLEEVTQAGYTFDVGAECEFFLFNTDDSGRPTVSTDESGGYFEMGPSDFGENARRDIVLALEDMGYEIESSHHEASPGQHEIDFKYSHALEAADDIITFKLAVKTIAKRHGLYATFMPKPLAGSNGSGMHINMSLSKDGKNIFFDPDDQYRLSPEAYYFIGGILKHAYAMTAITNPLVNSYKRIVSGFEAPMHIAWSVKNRSSLIRIPSIRDNQMRIELRSPDPTANPYLTLALCLAAGLDGLKKKITPPGPVLENIYDMTKEEKNRLMMRALPMDLNEAADAMESDPFVKGILGDHIANVYLNAKRKEWDSYCKSVTDWEVNEYLGKY